MAWSSIWNFLPMALDSHWNGLDWKRWSSCWIEMRFEPKVCTNPMKYLCRSTVNRRNFWFYTETDVASISNQFQGTDKTGSRMNERNGRLGRLEDDYQSNPMDGRDILDQSQLHEYRHCVLSGRKEKSLSIYSLRHVSLLIFYKRSNCPMQIFENEFHLSLHLISILDITVQ